ncbi:doublecortin domain-containing protein 2-like [Polymixia lowei]
MSSEKPNFLSQPVVKNIFMYRNGDPYYEARRIVINQKRVCNFETLLREVTGGVQAPFGAVRNIYTPRGGHKVDCMEHLHSGEQYVAAGREKFKKLNYLQIGSRKKKMMQTLPLQVKPVPQSRIIVSARFLKPIKEPCPIFVVANGDMLNPALRLLISQRMFSQFDRILELITEKMGLRILGGVRSLYTFEGQQIVDGKQLESGQFYVAVGREKFKKLPYRDLLFTKPRGTRRVNGTKAFSLPPIYRFSKQNGNSKSMVRCSNSGGGDSKTSPPAHSGNKKEHLSSIVREISQARLISLRKKRSGLSMSLGVSDNDDTESKIDDGKTDKSSQDQPAEQKATTGDSGATEGDADKTGEVEQAAAAENTTKEDTDNDNKEEKKENQEPNDESEGGATTGLRSNNNTKDNDRSSSSSGSSSSGSNSNQEEHETKTKGGNTDRPAGEDRELSGDKDGQEEEIGGEKEEEHVASTKDAKANGEKEEESKGVKEMDDKSMKEKDKERS